MKLSFNRSGLIFVVALLVGGLAAFGVNRYIKRQMESLASRGEAQSTVRVLVPKQDLPRGTALNAAVVAVREVPTSWAHSNAIAPEQFERMANQRLAYPAMRGEMLLWSQLEGERAPTFSARLTSGRRAITVPVDEVNSISGLLEPGDHIDLMVSVRKDSKSFMFALLQNVQILATGSRVVVDGEGKEGRRTYTTVTLEADPEQAQRVLAAREVGKVSALLRAPGDAASIGSDRRDALSWLGLGDAQWEADRREVPVLYGGAGPLKDVPALAAIGEPDLVMPGSSYPAPQSFLDYQRQARSAPAMHNEPGLPK